MDADGSHQPEQLPPLLDATAECGPGAGFALGRWRRQGGELAQVPSCCLGVAICGPASRWGCLKDATGGFRAFRRQTLLGIGLDSVASAGYRFQVDLAWRALKAGYRVVEVPITFIEREHGESKMNRAIVARLCC